MQRETAADLVAFLAIARAGSFTKAAVTLGVSQSALSHTIRGLEARLGLRLLARTTRSVAPTEAGERLLVSIGPRFDDIAAELAALSDLRDRPSGTIRITCGDHAAETILIPRLVPYLTANREVSVEVVVDYGLTDIVTERFDAGIRLGEQVDRDMVAVRIGPRMRMTVVGAPDYFARNAPPVVPPDLTKHECINLRLQTQGGFYAWEFARNGHQVNVRVTGQLAFNRTPQIVHAARLGMGLAFVPEDRAGADIDAGSLIRVLEDWCPAFDGYHLYYPSRRQPTLAFTLLVDALRWR